jgi:hypothetical protein
MSYEELALVLEEAGIPVVRPGAPDKGLPCISIEPTGMAVMDGYRALWNETNIVVRYAIGSGNTFNFDQLTDKTATVVGLLMHEKIALELEIPVYGQADAAQPALTMTIGCSFPSDHELC